MSFAKPASSVEGNPRKKGFLVVVVAALILGLFAFPSAAMAKDDKPPKVTVCKEKHDEYQIKMVKPEKVEKHLAKHDEDGVPGGPVPGMDGYNFGPDCVPVLACAPANVTILVNQIGRKAFIGLQTSDGTLVAGGGYGDSGFRSLVPVELLPGDFTMGIIKPNGQFVPGTAQAIHLDCGADFSASF